MNPLSAAPVLRDALNDDAVVVFSWQKKEGPSLTLTEVRERERKR